MVAAAGGDAAHTHRRRPRAATRHQRAHRARRGRRHLPRAVAAVEPVRGSQPEPPPRQRHVPRESGGEGSLRHRRRRERGRREEHDGAHPAGAARPLARPSAGRPRDDRRLPVPEPGARRARAHGPQRLPRELRPPTAGAVPRRREVGPARGERARLLAPDIRHRAGRGAGRTAARHRDRRGLDRAPDERRSRRPFPAAVRVGFLRLLALCRRGRGRHRAVVPRAVPHPPRDRVRRRALVLPPLRCAVRRRCDPGRSQHLAVDQRREPAREHPPHARAGAADPREGPRPLRPGGPAAQVVREPAEARKSRAARRESAARSDDGVVGEWPEAAVSEGTGGGEPDRAAFLAFYQEAVPEVYGYFLHRCRDSTTAEDLTSETFLAAVRNLEDDRPAPLDIPWVIGVARHKLADHWRRRAREERLRDALEQDPVPDEDPWDVRLDQLRANEVLAALGPHHRLALTLRYVDGLPVAAVAELLGRTPNATEALLVRARTAYRRVYLEGEGGGHD